MIRIQTARQLIWLVLFLAGPALAVQPGDTAPPFTARTFDGQAVQFPEAAGGRPAVIVFWATWCNYCKAFMPELDRITEKYAAAGVQIVTINAKEDGAESPADYIGRLDYPMIAVAGGDAIADRWSIQYIPGLLVVDGDGIVAWRRGWTDLPAGRSVADLWVGQVQDALDALIAGDESTT